MSSSSLRVADRTVRDVLRSEGQFGPKAERIPVRTLLLCVVLGGGVQGAVMGLHDGRALQAVFSAIKVPLLLILSTLIVLPSFYMLHLVLGLQRDFLRVCRATLVVQAVAAIFLASCAPLIGFAYYCSDVYPFATFVNGLAYLGAALLARVALGQQVRSLILREPKHRITVGSWLILYILVAIQLAWTMRPFVGWPEVEPSLFREEAWGNAYVRLFEALRKLVVAVG
ncbi:MAG: hypothetical protein AAF196_07540 [Planctomycetota bacterium]